MKYRLVRRDKLQKARSHLKPVGLARLQKLRDEQAGRYRAIAQAKKTLEEGWSRFGAVRGA